MKASIVLVLLLALLPAGAPFAQDAADSYRDARRALNRQQFDQAISGFQALRREYPDSDLVADSYYWEAFALERNGNLDRAVAVVDTLLREHPSAATLDDARALRIRVCSELARRGDGECAETISATVRNPDQLDQATRMAAVGALINMRADRAIPIAAQLAADRSQSVQIRKQALFIVADKANAADDQARAREILRTVALDETDNTEVRAQAVFWLSEVPGDDTLAILFDLVRGSADLELKKRAVFSISQHNARLAIARLRDLAVDESLDVEVRKQAIFWIGNEGGAQALPLLIELDATLTDTELKRQLLFAVSQTDAAGATEWLLSQAEDATEQIEVRKQAMFWAAQSGLSVEQLSSLYARVTERELRQQLIWLISDHGGEGSLDALFEIARSDPDPDMRAKAVFWIGDSDDPRAEEYILQLLGQ
jgi:tetratricopeptide (TPR) repeat protein